MSKEVDYTDPRISAYCRAYEAANRKVCELERRGNRIAIKGQDRCFAYAELPALTYNLQQRVKGREKP